MMMHICNLRTWEAEAGGWNVKGQADQQVKMPWRKPTERAKRL